MTAGSLATGAPPLDARPHPQPLCRAAACGKGRGCSVAPPLAHTAAPRHYGRHSRLVDGHCNATVQYRVHHTETCTIHLAALRPARVTSEERTCFGRNERCTGICYACQTSGGRVCGAWRGGGRGLGRLRLACAGIGGGGGRGTCMHAKGTVVGAGAEATGEA